jgi:type I restriction enzyme, S subunit
VTIQGEIRPGYKQTEVGVIPEDWGNDKLSRFVTEHRSGIYKKSATYGDGCNIVGVGDIYGVSAVDGRIFNRVPLSKDELKVFILQPGDLLYGESSLVREGIARTVYVKDGGENTAFAWHTRRYRVRQEHLDSEYLFYFLQSDLARQHMMSNAIQTALTGINTVAYFSCPVLVPPLKEQRAIAAALSDADALIATLEAMIAKKRDLKQAAMQHLLTGKTRLPGFSGEWEVKRLGDVANIKTGKRNNQDKQEDGAFPFFVRSETVERINSYSHDCEAILIPGEGNIGSIFHYIVGKFDVHQRVYAITNFIEGISGKFVHLWMRMNFGAHAMQNTVKATVDSLRLPTFQNFELMFPPTLTEQTAIAEVLSDMDADLAALEAQAAKARAVKQGMMQELLTGKVRLV